MKAEITVKENYEFRRIYRKGKSVVSPYMVLYCQKNRQGRTRLGVTVSTKLGKAVTRNRVRRRLREIYRLNEDRFLPGYDIVVVARVKAVRSQYADLNKQFLRLANKLQLLHPLEEKEP